MAYVLGVDGGSSKTHALVVDEAGRGLGFGRAGCANHQAAGLAPAMREIEKAAREALRAAGAKPEQVRYGSFCLSGADLEEDYALLTHALANSGLAQAVSVKNDTMAALRAGLSRPYGVAVICGTGFNAAGRAKDGRELILPGLGYISGDWGGGGQLSQEVIRLVMRAWDGRGPQTQLTPAVLARLDADSETGLLRRLYHREITSRQLLSLVPILFQVGASGDDVARQLIVKMGEEVVTTANTMLRRLSLLAEEVEVVLAGGVFDGQGPLLLETVQAGIHRHAPAATIRKLHHPPVVGAALLALEGTGQQPDAGVYRRLAESALFNDD